MNKPDTSSTDAYLRRVLVYFANRAAMTAAYASWADDYSRAEIREAWTDTDREPFGRRVTVAELIEIPDARLRELGFVSWDGALTVVPLWAFHFIADGEVLTSISGDTGTKGVKDAEGREEIDLDVRFGCIAYGFTKPGAVPEEDNPNPSSGEG